MSQKIGDTAPLIRKFLKNGGAASVGEKNINGVGTVKWGNRDGTVLHSGESTRLSPMWQGTIPGLGVLRGLSLLLVFVLVPRGSSPGTPAFSNSVSKLKIKLESAPS